MATSDQPHRRFPPPWTVETMDACFIVRDRNKQALTYVYFEEETGRRSASHLLARDEARRIAANIASCRGCCTKVKQARSALRLLDHVVGAGDQQWR
jgi:hypothetical protein